MVKGLAHVAQKLALEHVRVLQELDGAVAKLHASRAQEEAEAAVLEHGRL